MSAGLLLLLGVGAFMAMAAAKKKSTPSYSLPPPSTSEPPPPRSPSTSAPKAKEEVESFGFYVYPKNVTEVADEFLPVDSQSINHTPGCEVVTVGEDWYSLAKEAMLQAIHVLDVDPVEYVFEELVPSSCQVSTPGTNGLREEMERLADRLEERA